MSATRSLRVGLWCACLGACAPVQAVVDAGDAGAWSVRVPAGAFVACAFEPTDAGLASVAFTNAELALAESARVGLGEVLGAFDAAVSLDGDGGTQRFGPSPWGQGRRQGLLRAGADGGVDLEVQVSASVDGPWVQVLQGSQRGATLELLWDARAQRSAGDLLRDGRVGLVFTTVGAAQVASAVVAEWKSSQSAAALSTRATCAVDAATGSRVASVSALRDLDADGRLDTFAASMAWSAQVGGRSDSSFATGARAGREALGQAIECWGPSGAPVFRSASSGGTTVTEPVGADARRCPPPFDQRVVAPALQGLEVALLGRVYDGLHGRLTFPQRAQRVLWVGAHPDDEAFYAAPVLGHLCRDLGGTCTLLVATDGATGGCQVPTGCPPDLGTFRRAEMVKAAALYGASLRQLAWPPGPFPSETGVDLARWSAAQGGADALVAALRSAIEETDPEVLITFDPRHGSSCHAEHRVVSGLALEALRQSGKRPLVLLSEGLNPPPRFSDGRLLQFDATVASRTTGTDAWAYVAANLSQHPSQITPADVVPYATLPAPLRRVYFLSEPQPPPDSRYQFCPNP